MIFKHVDLAMLGLSIGCFLAAERWGMVPWGGLAFAALGVAGLVRGLIIVASRFDEENDGESGVQATRSGLAAVFYGLHFVFAGIVAISLGVAMALEWAGLGAWIRANAWTLVGVAGIWLSISGIVTMLGTEESRPETILAVLQQVPGRLIGLLVMLAGLAVAVFGLGRINPLEFL